MELLFAKILEKFFIDLFISGCAGFCCCPGFSLAVARGLLIAWLLLLGLGLQGVQASAV